MDLSYNPSNMHTKPSTLPKRGRAAAAIITAIVIFALMLAGCSGRTGDQTAAPTNTVRAPTAVRTLVMLPTNTATVAAAAETGTTQPAEAGAPASATITETPLPTAVPTLDPALAQVKLVGLSWLEKYKYNLLLSFDFPGPVDPADYRVTLEDKEYRCEVLEQYPNRLYCNGQGAKVLQPAQVRIYTAGSDQPGFETEVWVPYFQ